MLRIALSAVVLCADNATAADTATTPDHSPPLLCLTPYVEKFLGEPPQKAPTEKREADLKCGHLSADFSFRPAYESKNVFLEQAGVLQKSSVANTRNLSADVKYKFSYTATFELNWKYNWGYLKDYPPVGIPNSFDSTTSSTPEFDLSWNFLDDNSFLRDYFGRNKKRGNQEDSFSNRLANWLSASTIKPSYTSTIFGSKNKTPYDPSGPITDGTIISGGQNLGLARPSHF